MAEKVQNIEIKSGLLRVSINDDPERIIEFDPTDILFVERFYALTKEFEEKEKEYRQRVDEIEANDGTQIEQTIAVIKEFCKFLNEEIDKVFGENTSQKICGGLMDISAYEQFFDGIVPIVEQSRVKKVQKYLVQEK